jgi:hypothetical protein
MAAKKKRPIGFHSFHSFHSTTHTALVFFSEKKRNQPKRNEIKILAGIGILPIAPGPPACHNRAQMIDITCRG